MAEQLTDSNDSIIINILKDIDTLKQQHNLVVKKLYNKDESFFRTIPVLNTVLAINSQYRNWYRNSEKFKQNNNNNKNELMLFEFTHDKNNKGGRKSMRSIKQFVANLKRIKKNKPNIHNSIYFRHIELFILVLFAFIYQNSTINNLTLQNMNIFAPQHRSISRRARFPHRLCYH